MIWQIDFYKRETGVECLRMMCYNIHIHNFSQLSKLIIERRVCIWLD